MTACNDRQDAKEKVDSLTSIKTSEKINVSSKEIKNKADFLGIWTDGYSENASFNIRKDSIYYVDQFATYKYDIIGDSIKIYYPEWTFAGSISMSKDTMTIISEDGTTKYWKFKN